MKKLTLKQFISAGIGLSLLSISTSSFAVQANTDLILTKVSGSGNNIVMSIDIDNPSNQNVSSVQSWIEFDEGKLNCKSINTDESAFDFVVPGESNVSGNIVKIGRSSLSGDVADAKINVAKINCEILDKSIGSGEVKFHDYKTDGGKVSVMVFENGFPVNTLKGEPEMFEIEAEVSKVVENEIIETVADNGVNLNIISDYIERPSGLKIDTAIGSATLAWEKVSGAEKYYIYYGKISGRYLQRRLVPNNEIYKLEGLETGSQYFFSITAIGNGDLESDYSDEEAIIVGKRITSTSPISKIQNNISNNYNTNVNSGNISKIASNSSNNPSENIYLNSNIQKTDKLNQTGPTEVALISFVLALGMGVFVYRRKYI